MKSRFALGAALAAASLAFAATASAEPWVDYAPGGTVYVKTHIHVDSTKIDDYLVGLKKTWVPAEELLKKEGVLLSYAVQVNANAQTSEPNVVLLEQYPNWAALQPDKALDARVQAALEKILPKPQADAAMADRAKWRTFIAQDMWVPIDFAPKP